MKAKKVAGASSLSPHLDARGEARMVDVASKEITARQATARATVTMTPATYERLSRGDTPKGDVLATARIAAISAAKRTSELIPLCHLIALTKVQVDVRIEDGGVTIDATASATDRTGVEMEALVAASTGALVIYDMLKAIDRGMAFQVHLLEKRGGKTGTWKRK